MAARRSRWRHALWNHLGKTSGPVQPEAVSAELTLGDTLLLTTDGITDPLPDGALETLAGESGSARNLSCKIIRAAAERGGRDEPEANVTHRVSPIYALLTKTRWAFTVTGGKVSRFETGQA